MKKQILKSLSVALMLLGTTLTAFAAVDWNQYQFLGDAAGGGKYSNKYKVEKVAGIQEVVNIQKPGFATEEGIYLAFTSGITSCSVSSDIQGAGIILHLSAFKAKETEVSVVTATGTVAFHVFYADGGNVVLGGKAYASTGVAGLGNDGLENTRWESQPAAGATDAEKDAQWWLVNMGSLQEFNTVQILWEGAYAASFALEVSNDSAQWTEIKKIEGQTLAGFPYLQNISVGNQKAKYLRVNLIKRGTAWGYSFFELKAFVKEEQVLSSVELTSASSLVKVGESVKLTTVTKDQDGVAMDAKVTYTVSPADAGTVENGEFKAAKFGTATVTATAGKYSKSVELFVYEGVNAALSTNIDTDNKVVAQSGENTAGDHNGFFAVDGNEGSIFVLHDNTDGGVEGRTYDAWFVIDLGAFYDVNLVTIKFEGASSQNYHVDFSNNNVDWNTAYTYAGKEGIDARFDMIYGDNLQNGKGVRFVRFFNTMAATGYGVKIFEMQVFATEGAAPEDHEKPVMGTATLVSGTYNQAVVAVSATDNLGIASYHVVDAANAFDAKFVAVEGNITITGLTPATNYNFTITAIDLAGNESDNSAAVAVAMEAHDYAPAAAPVAPAHPAEKVKAIYSAAYNADCDFGEWGGGTIYTQEEFGKKYVNAAGGWFGLVGFELNCSEMEYLHVDVWTDNDMSMGIVPIHGGTEVRVTESIEGQKWNSIDIALSDFAGVQNWSKVYQLKFDNVQSKTFWLNNVYFYTTGATTVLNTVAMPADVQKRIENGQLVIIRDGVRYNAQGQVINK